MNRLSPKSVVTKQPLKEKYLKETDMLYIDFFFCKRKVANSERVKYTLKLMAAHQRQKFQHDCGESVKENSPPVRKSPSIFAFYHFLVLTVLKRSVA